MSTTKCIACGGTGKTVLAQAGNKTKLGVCGLCHGTGEIPTEVAEFVNDPLLGTIPFEKEVAQMTTDNMTPEQLRELADKLEAANGTTRTGFAAVAGQVAKTTGNVMVGAVGTKLAAGVNKKLVALAKASFTELLPQDDSRVDMALSLAIPIVLMLAAGVAKDSEALPAFVTDDLLDKVSTAGTFALKGVSEEAVEEIASRALPFLSGVAQLGMGLATGELAVGKVVDESVGEVESEAGS